MKKLILQSCVSGSTPSHHLLKSIQVNKICCGLQPQPLFLRNVLSFPQRRILVTRFSTKKVSNTVGINNLRSWVVRRIFTSSHRRNNAKTELKQSGNSKPVSAIPKRKDFGRLLSLASPEKWSLAGECLCFVSSLYLKYLNQGFHFSSLGQNFCVFLLK